MTNNRMSILSVCKLLLVMSAITCFVIGVCLAFSTVAFLSSATKCPGIVIEIIAEKNNERGRDMYRPKIEYVIPSGEKHVFVSSVASHPQRYFVGNNVVVLYSKKHISGEARIDSFLEIWMGTSIFLASAIVSIVFAWILKLVMPCPCPTPVREVENADPDAETGAEKEE